MPWRVSARFVASAPHSLGSSLFIIEAQAAWLNLSCAAFFAYEVVTLLKSRCAPGAQKCAGLLGAGIT
jgi:hypothetical protein